MTVVACSDQSQSPQKSLYWITKGSDLEDEELDKFIPIETNGEKKQTAS